MISFIKLLRKYPPQQLWRLLVDVVNQHEGPLWHEEKEENTLKSMMSGLNFVLETYNQPINVDYLISLQQKCVQYTYYVYHVKVADENGRRTEVIREKFPIGIREHGTEFGLAGQEQYRNWSVAGIQELVDEEIKNNNFIKLIDHNKCSIASPGNIPSITHLIALIKENKISVSIAKHSIHRIKHRLDSIIKNYYASIESSKTDDEKLWAIATCVHLCELTHPFSDGNCRSFGVVLLIKLLLENGFPPAIFSLRDKFDAFAIHELVDEIKWGIERYKRQQLENELEHEAMVPVIFLAHNRSIIKYIVEYSLENNPIWHKLPLNEKTIFIEKCISVIANSHIDRLTFKELNQLIENINALFLETIRINKSFINCYILFFGDKLEIDLSKFNSKKFMQGLNHSETEIIKKYNELSQNLRSYHKAKQEWHRPEAKDLDTNYIDALFELPYFFLSVIQCHIKNIIEKYEIKDTKLFCSALHGLLISFTFKNTTIVANQLNPELQYQKIMSLLNMLANHRNYDYAEIARQFDLPNIPLAEVKLNNIASPNSQELIEKNYSKLLKYNTPWLQQQINQASPSYASIRAHTLQ